MTQKQIKDIRRLTEMAYLYTRSKDLTEKGSYELRSEFGLHYSSQTKKIGKFVYLGNCVFQWTV